MEIKSKMESENLLLKFESENYDEIKSVPVEIDDLKNYMISETAMKAEVFLRQIYGDDFLEKRIVEGKEKGRGVVEKISVNEIETSKNLKDAIAKIENDKFNASLESLLPKVKR